MRTSASQSAQKRPRDRPTEVEVDAVLAWLKRRGTKANREGMARYAIRSEKVFGVSVATLRQRAKTLGRNHELASALWETGWYEARMLAAFVDERNFVKKAVNWALRSIGGCRPGLHASTIALAQRLAASPDKTARWIGKDAVRQLGSPAVARRLAARVTKEKS